MRAFRLALLLGLALAPAVQAQTKVPVKVGVKIGVVTDMSGFLSAMAGPGAVTAAEMAVEDCLAAECAGMHIEVLSADHQNKPDVAVGIVRKWIDVDQVDVIADIIQSAVQLAIQGVAKEKDRIALFPSATARLVNEDCAPATGVVWMWDTYSQALGITTPLVKPGSKWFIITPNYAFGAALQADTTELVTRGGGTVVGVVRHPFGFAGDFSPFLLQAQSSGADVIAIGSAGSDLVNLLKQASEFGMGTPGSKQVLASLILSLPDVAALGLATAQGVRLNESFYWDFDEGTRAFSRRFLARHKAMPSANQAGIYSSVTHYLHSVAAAGTTQTAAVMAKMHQLPIEDGIVKHATLRPDGRMQHDTYLFRVKTSAESKGPYDFYALESTIPADKAFRPLSESLCPALKKG